MNNFPSKKGFTLIEVVISIAIFVLFAVGAYRGYASLYAAIAAAHHKALAADLINARFEIIKNLPYTNVGVTGGNPNGVVVGVQTIVKDGISFVATTTIRYVDDPFDGVSGSGDIFPNDYKLVEISVGCTTCKNFIPVVITGRVAPKNLESA
jgi:prepilin-type N-terminal cleavage/methylation domain-containing protein